MRELEGQRVVYSRFLILEVMPEGLVTYVLLQRCAVFLLSQILIIKPIDGINVNISLKEVVI